MKAMVSAWLLMITALCSGCDGDLDHDHGYAEPWGHAAPPYDDEYPRQSGQVAPQPTYDASAPLARPSEPSALAPAIAWRAKDGQLYTQPVSFAGLFPDTFTLQTYGLRPPAQVLTLLSEDRYGGSFAYGEIVAVRPATTTSVAPCATSACATSPGANASADAAVGCGGTACGDRACSRTCGSSPCGSACGAPAPRGGGSSAAEALVAGVVEGYIVLYNEREIAAGSLLAGVFNDYRTLAPGLHLIRTDVLTAEQTEQATSCRRAALERALERYNGLEQTSFEDDTELRSELTLRALLGDPAAAQCAVRYERLIQAAHVEQRCRFRLLAQELTSASTCPLRVTMGAALSGPLPLL